MPDQLQQFCEGKDAVLLLEEGQPEYIEQELATLLRRAGIATPLHGKDLLPSAGEYSAEVMAQGLLAFLQQHLAEPLASQLLPPAQAWLDGNRQRREQLANALPQPLPPRPPYGIDRKAIYV